MHDEGDITDYALQKAATLVATVLGEVQNTGIVRMRDLLLPADAPELHEYRAEACSDAPLLTRVLSTTIESPARPKTSNAVLCEDPHSQSRQVLIALTKVFLFWQDGSIFKEKESQM
eukprot:2766953-Amphidinium_carterae.1